jgi:hypothetical protein
LAQKVKEEIKKIKVEEEQEVLTDGNKELDIKKISRSKAFRKKKTDEESSSGTESDSSSGSESEVSSFY